MILRHPVIFLTEQTLRIVQRLVQEANSHPESIFWLIGSVSTLEPGNQSVALIRRSFYLNRACLL